MTASVNGYVSPYPVDPMPGWVTALRDSAEPLWLFAYGSLMWNPETPFAVGSEGVPSRAVAVERYRSWLPTQPDLLAAARAELAGRDLLCWCPPDGPCHADVLLAVVNDGGSR